jgi:hypothetical protein
MFSRKDQARVWNTLQKCDAGSFAGWATALLTAKPRIFRGPNRDIDIPRASDGCEHMGLGRHLFPRWEGHVGWKKLEGQHASQRTTPCLDSRTRSKSSVIRFERFTTSRTRPEHIVFDNTTVAGALARRRSSAFHLNKVIEQIAYDWRICTITYVRSDSNPADPLSRGAQVHSWEKTRIVAEIATHQPS